MFLSKTLVAKCNELEQCETAYYKFTAFLSIDKASRNSIRNKHLIVHLEFLEDNSVGISFTADTNSFQHTITPGNYET